MRYIKKKTSPQFFADWKNNYRNTEGKEPTYDDLRGQDYHNLKIHIIEEQYSLCLKN